MTTAADDDAWLLRPFPAPPDAGLQSRQHLSGSLPGTAPAHRRSDRLRPRADMDRLAPEDIDVLFDGALNER